MHYILKRSKRKTLSVEVTPKLEVLVRAPQRAPKHAIDAFVERELRWIEKQLERQRVRAEKAPPPTEGEMEALISAASAYIPARVAHYALKMGLWPTGIKITRARTRYGSCSAKDSLCFSCLLMRYPMEAIDYVVVHELAHISHKNHQADFYALVESILPDYRARRAMLKHGANA